MFKTLFKIFFVSSFCLNVFSAPIVNFIKQNHEIKTMSVVNTPTGEFMKHYINILSGQKIAAFHPGTL